MRKALKAALAEPRVPDPPTRVWRDWALLGALMVGAVVEGFVHADLLWRPVTIVIGFALTVTVLWRRSHPLAMLAVTFGTIFTLDLLGTLIAGRTVELYTSGFVLILLYALFRWGSGREVAVGLAIALLVLVESQITSYTGLGDAIGGAIILLVPAELGAMIRYQRKSRHQQLEQVKLEEREMLARELHDTVAHHVSAIVIQAQAGRFLAKSSSLEGAADALEVIEEEAARTLAEMRAIVAGLRDGLGSPTRPAEMSPQRGIAEIEQLAKLAASDSPQVDVELAGDLHHLRPSVESALYRLAQESITNALRHARNPTRVLVRVVGDDESVRLTVSDNGEVSSVNAHAPGYGLVGMSERTTLLGGSLDAGPGPERGWIVQAVLPRRGRFA